MERLFGESSITILLGFALVLVSCSNSKESPQPNIDNDKIYPQSVGNLIETPLCEVTKVTHDKGTCRVIVKHTFSQIELNSYNVKVSSLNNCITTDNFLWSRERTIFKVKELNEHLFNQSASYEVHFTANKTTAVLKTSSSEYKVNVVKNKPNSLSFVKNETGEEPAKLSKELCEDEVNPEIRVFCSEAKMKELGEYVASATPGTVAEQTKKSLRPRLGNALFVDDICYFTNSDRLFDVFLESGKY